MSAQPMTTSDTGVLLDGRYRVGELIARGGMASVHRGHDERLDRPVALKIMHPHLADDEGFRRRFGQEARSVARLAHRHVVGVFDQGEDGDRIYLAMELVEGGTLRGRIAETGRLSVREALEVTRAVLEALAAAHDAGIVHRDIKPENILLSSTGEVKVADFGLARVIGAAHSSATSTMMGTVAYVSPEVITRGACDERSDLYSLGVVLYEMLVGSQPYVGDAPVHIAFQHVHEDIPAPSLRAPHVPSGVDSLVTWCCARVPGSRPASARAALASVQDLQRTLSAAVLDAAPLERAASDTQDVPRLTARLEDVDLTAEGGARAFPEGLARRAADSLGLEDGPADPERTVSGDEEARDEGDAQELRLRPRRLPRGRHLSGPLHRPAPGMRAAAALAVLALTAGSGWSAWAWYGTAGPGGDRTVPVLEGEQLAAAEAALAGEDLDTRTSEQFSDTVPAGTVISATPGPGTVVKRDTAVTIIVSTGPQTYPVPDVVGKDVAAATSLLEGANLQLVEGEPAYSEEVPEGAIISQTTPGDAEALPAGGAVTVTVSQGREPILVEDQRGRGYDTATANLEGAGLVVTTSWEYSTTVPHGAIISQTSIGHTLHRGDTVALVISKGGQRVPVPEVTGRSAADATAALKAAGFEVAVQEQPATPPTGLVTGQSVPGGTPTPQGRTITITVS
ncbi:Stk1 family PASTA domain-containing Ser/Thr kinase [Brachybacterium hainanense]|uniref:non-specific serine/threonine protein kinase n=1 Tax=Brachybacterium hainanense TaxID=1541174 RepID=A0ABV6RG62_9MICO